MATPSLGLATQAAQASTSIPRHILKQSLFFAFCPDAPDALGRRMEVRAKHWERAQVDKKDGVLCESQLIQLIRSRGHQAKTVHM